MTNMQYFWLLAAGNLIALISPVAGIVCLLATIALFIYLRLHP